MEFIKHGNSIHMETFLKGKLMGRIVVIHFPVIVWVYKGATHLEDT